MTMVSREDVRRDALALREVLDKALETMPPGEIGLFHEFVSRVVASINAVQERWEPVNRTIHETRAGTTIASDKPSNPSPDISAIQAELVRALSRLWDSAPPPYPETPTDRYFPLRNDPRYVPGDAELQKARHQWEEALQRGKGWRDQAAELLGTLLTPAEVSRRLGVTPVTVKNWRQQNKLLGLKFDDHQYVYPEFQFAASPDEGESGILRHFPELLRALPFGSGWAKAQFFVTPLPALQKQSPIHVLRQVAAMEARDDRNGASKEQLARLQRAAERAGEMGA